MSCIVGWRNALQMNIEDISQETIRAYLAGSLDEASVELIDELSITSQDIADRIAVEQFELIDDWVGGRLTPSDRARFEAALARSPTLREKAEVSGLIAAASPRAAVVERTEKRSLMDRLSGWVPRFAYGFAAAAVVLVVVAISVLVLRDGPDQEVSLGTPSALDSPVTNAIKAPSPQPSASETVVDVSNTVNAEPQPSRTPAEPRRAERQPQLSRVLALTLAPPTRSSNEIRTVRIEPGVEYLDLNLQTEADPDGKLRVEIGDAASDQVEWRSAAIAPVSRNGRLSVRVRLPVYKLRSGLRSVRLRQTTGDGAILDEHAVRIIR